MRIPGLETLSGMLTLVTKFVCREPNALYANYFFLAGQDIVFTPTPTPLLVLGNMILKVAGTQSKLSRKASFIWGQRLTGVAELEHYTL